MEESDQRVLHQQPLIPDQFRQSMAAADPTHARRINQGAASASTQVYDPDFIKQRAKQVVENRQDINFTFPGKSALKEGYDLSRLVSPSIAQVNDDFLCAICQSKQKITIT